MISSEFEYPLFKRWENTNEVYRFISIKYKFLVWRCDCKLSLWDKLGLGIAHTDKRWTNVPYDKERDLWHGQPVTCSDDSDTHKTYNGFYDAIYKSSFNYKGGLDGLEYDNYKAVPIIEYTDWHRERYKTLELGS